MTFRGKSRRRPPFGRPGPGKKARLNEQQLDAAEVGKTTQDDVRGDTQVWYYDFVKIKSFGKNIQEATVFEFGKTGNPLIDAANGK